MNVHEFGFYIPWFKGMLAREVILQRFAKQQRKQPTDPRHLHLHLAFARDVRNRGHYLRHLHLAVAFMRGHAYQSVEKTKLKVDTALLVKMLPWDWTTSNCIRRDAWQSMVQQWLDGEVFRWKKGFPRRAGGRPARAQKADAAE